MSSIPPSAAAQGSPQGTPTPPQAEVELLRLRAAYEQQNEEGRRLHAQYTALKAEKASLDKKLDRGGASKLLQQATRFTGQNGMLLEEWIDDLEVLHGFFHIAESEKVEIGVLLLKGPAAHWWKNLIAKGQSTQVWSEMKDKMKDMFQPISSIDKARAALDFCVQGKRSVQSYTDAFHRLLAWLPGMDEGDQKHRYISNLNSGLRIEVLKSKPKNLAEATHAAVSAEAYGADSRNGAGASAKFGGNYGRYGPPRANSAGGGHGGVPMELSNVNHALEQDFDSMAVGSDYGDAEPASTSNSSSSHSSANNGREKYLLNMIKELQAKQKVQESVNSMFQGQSSRGSSSRGSSSSSGNRVPGVSKEDFERCRREGRCLNCKQKDHIARDCKNSHSLKW
jgi:Retrotransposon gag protein